MFVYDCVSVCVYLCMHACMHTYMRACICVCVRVCACVCVCARACVCMCIVHLILQVITAMKFILSNTQHVLLHCIPLHTGVVPHCWYSDANTPDQCYYCQMPA